MNSFGCAEFEVPVVLDVVRRSLGGERVEESWQLSWAHRFMSSSLGFHISTKDAKPGF